MRFLQLIYLLQNRYSQLKGGTGQIEIRNKDGSSKVGYDLFHVEDDGFADFLKDYLKNKQE